MTSAETRRRATQPSKKALIAEWMVIGAENRWRLGDNIIRSIDIDALLYDEDGLPK